MSILSARFYLKYGNENLGKIKQIDLNGCQIKIEADNEKQDLLDRIDKDLELKRETYILSLKGLKSESEFSELAIDIKNLLSLGTGQNVIFDRQEFLHEDKINPVLRKMLDPVNSGFPIIKNSDLENFIIECLPNWKLLNKADKNTIYVSFDYLNQTKNGFIEDRILRTVQAWESLAKYWEIKAELVEPLKDLRKEILGVYKNWCKSETNKKIDPKGDLGTDLARVIDRNKLLNKLENLASEYKLDYEILNIDFKRLIKLRDQVAHSGRIRHSAKESGDLMYSAIKGLQIIILNKLKYTGNIIVNPSKNSETVSIGNF